MSKIISNTIGVEVLQRAGDRNNLESAIRLTSRKVNRPKHAWLSLPVLQAITLTWAGTCHSATLSFTAPTGYPSGVSVTGNIGIQDFNKDGNQDVVTLDSLGHIGVLLGKGDGTFEATANYVDGGFHEGNSMSFADFNHDGNPDIATANYLGAGQDIAILLGHGDGTFPTTTYYSSANSSAAYLANNCPGVSLSTSQGPALYSLTTADVNGDGKPDLIAGSANISTTSATAPCSIGNTQVVGVFLGNGDGTFGAAAYIDLESGASGNITGIAAADANGDGKLDLVATVDNANKVYVLLGNGDGTFSSSANYAVGSLPSAVQFKDVNKDGKPDIVTLNQSAGTVSVLLGNGDGTFGTANSYPVGATPESLNIADINGDGNLDIIAAPNFQEVVPTSTLIPELQASVLLGNGDGTFQTVQPVTVATAFSGVASGGEDIVLLTATTVGDLNNDGAQDIIAGGTLQNAGGSIVSVVLNQGVTASQPPSSPTGLTATAGNGQITLSWTASSGASSYDVYEGTTAGSESATPVKTGITATSTTITGLTNGTAYYFKVAAVNAAGASAPSTEASATPSGVASSGGGGGMVTPVMLGILVLGFALRKNKMALPQA